MKTNFKNVIELLDYYKDDATCIKLLEQQRWGDKPCCPHCGYNEKIYRTNRGFRCANKECGKKFSVTVGTIYENSKIKLRIWFAAMYLITAHKKGISSHQLSRDLGITQKTAWFVLHRVREMLKADSEQLDTMVEVDETYVGGKHKNRHAWKREEIKQAGFKDKTMVVGFVRRESEGKLKKVKTKIVPNTTSASLIVAIGDNVAKGSIMVTDEHPAYKAIVSRYIHHKVNHSAGEYVNGFAHTNSIENFWSLLKRGIVGIYHHVTPKHLERYCDEFAYRFNSREKTDQERFHFILTHTEGRLKYSDLIAKQQSDSFV